MADLAEVDGFAFAVAIGEEDSAVAFGITGDTGHDLLPLSFADFGLLPQTPKLGTAATSLRHRANFAANLLHSGPGEQARASFAAGFGVTIDRVEHSLRHCDADAGDLAEMLLVSDIDAVMDKSDKLVTELTALARARHKDVVG